jgi:hypothetical protein
LADDRKVADTNSEDICFQYFSARRMGRVFKDHVNRFAGIVVIRFLDEAGMLGVAWADDDEGRGFLARIRVLAMRVWWGRTQQRKQYSNESTNLTLL